MWVMQRYRVPIPYMVGPLLASAVLRIAGLVEGVLPHQLIELALVVTGALTGQDFLVALLAYAPGGVAEMSLIALAIDANPGFVAIHHVARIIFVLLAVPVLTAWVGRKKAPEA